MIKEFEYSQRCQLPFMRIAKLQKAIGKTKYRYTIVMLMHNFSADSFTILPTANLGIEYVAVGARYITHFPNVLMAVAYQDNTTVGRFYC